MAVFWQAFWDLHTDRPMGFGGALPIPFSSVDRYASRYRIEDPDEFDRFASVIRIMDRAYLQRAEEQRKSEPTS